MKNRKILSSILVLAVMFGLSSFVQAADPVVETDVINGYSNFEDMVPSLEHNEPYVDTVISCNMVLKPKTQINLSRLCDSAVTNLNYYFNGSGNVQKGPDYNNTVKEETFYPASRRISNDYLGGTIDYKVASEFQTKKSTGEKINLETPDEFKHAVIISSKVVHIVDMGVAYTLYQPTGDQSQDDWIGVMKGYPALSGREGNWTFRFGTLEDNGSNVLSFFKSSKQSGNKVLLLANLNAMNLSEDGTAWDDVLGDGTDEILYLDSAQPNNQESVFEISKKAKRLVMEYNLNPMACDGSKVLSEEGWVAIDGDQAKRFLKITDTGIEYPEFLNAWGRIYAIMSEPSDNDYRPAKRVRVKSRIGNYGGFKFNNLVDGDVVKIYTVNGQKVAELTAGESSEGFEWKGRKGTNNSGDWAKSGIYVYQIKLKEQGKIISGTIVLAY